MFVTSLVKLIALLAQRSHSETNILTLLQGFHVAAGESNSNSVNRHLWLHRCLSGIFKSLLHDEKHQNFKKPVNFGNQRYQKLTGFLHHLRSSLTGCQSCLLTASPHPGIRPQKKARPGTESRRGHNHAAPPPASPWLQRGFLTDLFLGESEQR